MSYKYKTAVYIGRFQPIHKAHLETIKKSLDIADKLIIFVGSDNRSTTIKNPFDTAERIAMMKYSIKEYFGENVSNDWSDYPKDTILSRIMFMGCRDYLYNNYNWSSEITSKVMAVTSIDTDSTSKDIILIGCMKDDSSYYLKMFPHWDFERVPYMYELDATNIRNEVYEEGSVLTYEKYLTPSIVTKLNNTLPKFADEYKYYKEYQESHSFRDTSINYSPVHNTTDSIVIKSGCILLIQRKFHPGVNKYALPGGFLNANESLRDCALRELKEETKITVPISDLDGCIATYKYFDHPKRSLRGRVITHVFLIDLGYGALPNVKESSDARGAMWVPLSDVMKMEDELFEDHYDIIVNMISKY